MLFNLCTNNKAPGSAATCGKANCLERRTCTYGLAHGVTVAGRFVCAYTVGEIREAVLLQLAR